MNSHILLALSLFSTSQTNYRNSQKNICLHTFIFQGTVCILSSINTFQNYHKLLPENQIFGVTTMVRIRDKNHLAGFGEESWLGFQ